MKSTNSLRDLELFEELNDPLSEKISGGQEVSQQVLVTISSSGSGDPLNFDFPIINLDLSDDIFNKLKESFPNLEEKSSVIVGCITVNDERKCSATVDGTEIKF